MDARRYPPRMTQSYPPPPAAPGRPRWLIPTIVAAFLLLAAAAWAGGYWWTHRGTSVNGDITVTDLGGIRSVGATCETTGGYTDIHAGAQVTITDSSGAVVGVATLGPGSNGGAGGGRCTFAFSASVDADSDFYGFSLGPRRGVLQVPADQLANVHLTLGS